MSIHQNSFLMQREALKEMLEVAEYCLYFDKSKSEKWNGYIGCYGYPCATILLSIVDCVGSMVENDGGYSTRTNFKILNNKEYYNLDLSDDEIEIFRHHFRDKLSHNAKISDDNYVLLPSHHSKKVLICENGVYFLNLETFYKLSRQVVEKVLTLENNNTK